MKLAAGAVLLCLSGCAPLTVDHTPQGDLLDSASSSLDTDNGKWVAWFSTAITHDTTDAAVGAGFLRVEVTKAFGWGIQVDNYPGYAAKPGTYRAGFWARAQKGSDLKAALKLAWYDAQENDLTAPELTSATLTPDWQHFNLETTAPAETARLSVSITGRTEDTGDLIDFDEILVVPKP